MSLINHLKGSGLILEPFTGSSVQYLRIDVIQELLDYFNVDSIQDVVDGLDTSREGVTTYLLVSENLQPDGVNPDWHQQLHLGAVTALYLVDDYVGLLVVKPSQ